MSFSLSSQPHSFSSHLCTPWATNMKIMDCTSYVCRKGDYISTIWVLCHVPWIYLQAYHDSIFAPHHVPIKTLQTCHNSRFVKKLAGCVPWDLYGSTSCWPTNKVWMGFLIIIKPWRDLQVHGEDEHFDRINPQILTKFCWLHSLNTWLPDKLNRFIQHPMHHAHTARSIWTCTTVKFCRRLE